MKMGKTKERDIIEKIQAIRRAALTDLYALTQGKAPTQTEWCHLLAEVESIRLFHRITSVCDGWDDMLKQIREYWDKVEKGIETECPIILKQEQKKEVEKLLK